MVQTETAIEYQARVALARQEWLDRQARRRHPAGRFDNARRWYPAEQEQRACCARIRPPSRRWPYSLLLHCRTAAHVASLYDVEPRDVVRMT